MLTWSTPRFDVDDETSPVVLRKWYVLVVQAVLSMKVSGNVVDCCVAFVAVIVAVLICVFGDPAPIAAIDTLKTIVRVAVAPGASVPRFVQTTPLFVIAVATAPLP